MKSGAPPAGGSSTGVAAGAPPRGLPRTRAARDGVALRDAGAALGDGVACFFAAGVPRAGDAAGLAGEAWAEAAFVLRSAARARANSSGCTTRVPAALGGTTGWGGGAAGAAGLLCCCACCTFRSAARPPARSRTVGTPGGPPDTCAGGAALTTWLPCWARRAPGGGSGGGGGGGAPTRAFLGVTAEVAALVLAARGMRGTCVVKTCGQRG